MMEINLPVFEIGAVLFLYFLFLWSFRIFFLIVLLKIAGKIKENVEHSLKEKMDSLKGGLKNDNENV
jgi:hypothetical protein